MGSAERRLTVLPVVGMERGLALLRQLLASDVCRVPHVVVLQEDSHESKQWRQCLLAEAAAHGITATVGRRLSGAQWAALVATYTPDALFVLGWRSLIDPAAVAAVPHGVLAAHDSPLPDLRGFAPVSWGILLGRETFGVTLIRIDAGIDSGPVLAQRLFQPGPRPRVADVMAQIAEIAPGLFLEYLHTCQAGPLPGTPQDHRLATFGPKRTPLDGEIDWHQSADAIDRLVRATGEPLPGAYTWWGCEKLRILEGEPCPDAQPYAARLPGAVQGIDRDAGWVDVMAGEGLFRLTRVAVGAGATVPAAEVLRSLTVRLGPLRLEALLEKWSGPVGPTLA